MKRYELQCRTPLGWTESSFNQQMTKKQKMDFAKASNGQLARVRLITEEVIYPKKKRRTK